MGNKKMRRKGEDDRKMTMKMGHGKDNEDHKDNRQEKKVITKKMIKEKVLK